MFQVIQIGFVGISLSFKANIEICTFQVLKLYDSNEPLHYIPQIKADYKQFDKLSGVNLLVVQLAVRQRELSED
jgi:hypothetical protein